MLAPEAVRRKLRQKLWIKRSVSRLQTKVTSWTIKSVAENQSQQSVCMLSADQQHGSSCCQLLKVERSANVGQ